MMLRPNERAELCVLAKASEPTHFSKVDRKVLNALISVGVVRLIGDYVELTHDGFDQARRVPCDSCRQSGIVVRMRLTDDPVKTVMGEYGKRVPSKNASFVTAWCSDCGGDGYAKSLAKIRDEARDAVKTMEAINANSMAEAT